MFWRRSETPTGGTPAALPVEITAAELHIRLQAEEPPFLLDVRSHGEFAGGHIPGSVLIPLPELLHRASEIPAGRHVICVCRSGHRSGIAAHQLRARGYSVQSLAEGMLGWRGAVRRL